MGSSQLQSAGKVSRTLSRCSESQASRGSRWERPATTSIQTPGLSRTAHVRIRYGAGSMLVQRICIFRPLQQEERTHQNSESKPWYNESCESIQAALKQVPWQYSHIQSKDKQNNCMLRQRRQNQNCGNQCIDT